MSDTVDATDANTDEQQANADEHPWDEWEPMIVSGRHVPESLREMKIWLLWSPEFGKTPMAPWETGHMYPASWGSGVDERPETTFDKADMIATMGPETIHRNFSFPPLDDGDEPHIPERVLPTILLPHEPASPPLMQVDFDDVRNPETGTVSPEVADIVDRLDAYTEVSQSGEGLHTFVRAELPGALGKFIGSLDTVGDIELYDHGRFVGATWAHVVGTPTDVPERQDVIDELVREYETEAQQRRRKRDPRRGVGGSPEAKRASDELDGIRGSFVDYSGLSADDVDDDADDDAADADTDADTGDGGQTAGGAGSSSSNPQGSGGSSAGSRRNAYYHELDLDDVVFEGAYGSAFSRHASGGSGRSWLNGPHPGHGPQKSEIEECTNFGIRDDGWSCFAHEGGAGGALALLAVVENVVRCDEAAGVHDNPAAMLKTCLLARDLEPALEDEAPPYMALVGVAEQFDLPMADPSDNRLGESKSIARQIYDEMEPADVDGA